VNVARKVADQGNSRQITRSWPKGPASSGQRDDNRENSAVQTSTFTANAAPGGSGGGVFFRGSPITMTNCTLSGNSSRASGGFRTTSANLSVNNSTITNNSGGGFQSSGNTSIRNTIASANTGGTGDASTGGGNYVVENCLVGGSPLLGPLTNNGGPTSTHALMDGSPAIDAGNRATCASTDQRGVACPIGSACDVGAIESNLRRPTTHPAVPER